MNVNVGKTLVSAGLAILLVIAIVYLRTPQQVEPKPNPPAKSEEQRINEFFEAVFEREISLSPIRQSSLGRKTDQLGQWDDFSDAFAAGEVNRTKKDYEQLKSAFDYEALSDDARLSYDLFALNAEREIRNFEFIRNHYIVDQFNGQLSGLITVLQNNHRIENVKDAEDYISRIAALEKVLQEFTRQLQDRASYGVIAPAFSFPDVINDARSISSGAPIEDTSRDNAVYVDFRDKVTALRPGAVTTDDLLMRAAAALKGPFKSGFGTLIAEIERQQQLADDNRGVWSLPDGTAYYRNRIYHHTTLDLGSDEIHDIGLQEVDRIHEEMRAIKTSVGFDGTLREFFDFIRKDQNNYHED